MDQLRREDLADMSPEAINQALKDGRLYDMLHGIERPRKPRGLVPEEVEAAIAGGTLDELKARVQAERQAAADAPVTDADQGARGTPAVASREWLRTASPREIHAALKRGDLDALLREEGPQP